MPPASYGESNEGQFQPLLAQSILGLTAEERDERSEQAGQYMHGEVKTVTHW